MLSLQKPKGKSIFGYIHAKLYASMPLFLIQFKLFFVVIIIFIFIVNVEPSLNNKSLKSCNNFNFYFIKETILQSGVSRERNAMK